MAMPRENGLPTTPHPYTNTYNGVGPPNTDGPHVDDTPRTEYSDYTASPGGASPSSAGVPFDFSQSPPHSARDSPLPAREPEGLEGRIGRMSLPPHMHDFERRRESRQDSEDQAAGIFDLYDTDTGTGNGTERDSWTGGEGGSGARRPDSVQSGLGAGMNGMNGMNGGGRGRMEQLREEQESQGMETLNTPTWRDSKASRGSRGSQGSWEGPFSALSNPEGLASPTEPVFGEERRRSGTGLVVNGNGNGSGTAATHRQSVQGHNQSVNGQYGVNGTTSNPGSRRSSLAPPIPPITLTPDKSALSHLINGDQRHNRDSSLSASTSTSTSTSLAPSPSKFGNGGGASRLSPARAVRGNGSANASAVSVASEQYPGEENDAFYVRSTYARLEAEGVHGDGWDPGVERTRGGPQQGKRATMFEANKAGDVGQAEREFLANLDRYGFVNEPLRNRSETRVALIPTAPLLKIPKLPDKSPIPPNTPVPPPPAFDGREGPTAKSPGQTKTLQGEADRQRKKEDARVGKWMKMMSVKKRDQGGNTVQWGWRDAQKAKVVKRVYKGIPDRWRMAAWWTMADEAVGKSKGKGREGRSAEALAEEYRHRIDLPSTHDVQIDLDVPRTISGHTLFVTRYGAGQRSLFHVLHCFSLLCDTCGYCQGMGPIAATLLCYFDPERVYALMVRLHDVYGMHSIFAPGFPGLLEAFYVQERLMEFLMPDVYKSFQRNMISSSAWGTKWYITLFVNTLPFSQQLRLWDALWLEGRDVMIITAISILWAFKDLLAAPTANFESILSLLSSYFVAEDEDAMMRFIRKMLALPGMKDRMDGWRKEWAGLVRDGKSGSALL